MHTLLRYGMSALLVIALGCDNNDDNNSTTSSQDPSVALRSARSPQD